MICPFCGASIPDGSNFCGECGKALPKADGVFPASPVPPFAGDLRSDIQDMMGQQEQRGPQPEQERTAEQTTPVIYNYIPVERSIALCIIFTILTCGLYSLYWIYVLNEDISDLAGEKPSMNGVLVILLSILTCGIFGFYWCYKMGAKLVQAQQMNGFPAASDTPLICLLLSIFQLGIISLAILQDGVNTIVRSNRNF